MLAVFVGALNAGIEAELDRGTERPNLDDRLVDKLRTVAHAVRTRVAREFNADEAEIALPHIYRGVDDLVVDLADEQKRAWAQVVPPPITAVEASRFADVAGNFLRGTTAGSFDPPPTCAECARHAVAEQAATERADIAEEEVARLERQLLMISRAFGLIKDCTSTLAIKTNENLALNTAAIIEHIVEAAEGDSGAVAALRVLGIELEPAE
jgi:hypothetical protein